MIFRDRYEFGGRTVLVGSSAMLSLPPDCRHYLALPPQASRIQKSKAREHHGGLPADCAAFGLAGEPFGKRERARSKMRATQTQGLAGPLSPPPSSVPCLFFLRQSWSSGTDLVLILLGWEDQGIGWVSWQSPLLPPVLLMTSIDHTSMEVAPREDGVLGRRRKAREMGGGLTDWLAGLGLLHSCQPYQDSRIQSVARRRKWGFGGGLSCVCSWEWGGGGGGRWRVTTLRVAYPPEYPLRICLSMNDEDCYTSKSAKYIHGNNQTMVFQPCY